MTKNQIKQEAAQEIADSIVRYRESFGAVISAAAHEMLTDIAEQLPTFFGENKND